MRSENKQGNCGSRIADRGKKHAVLQGVLLLFAVVFLVPVVSGAVETAPAATVTAAAVSIPLVTGPVATAPSATAPDLAGLIEEHYRGIVDLTARVVQKNYVRSVNKTQTFEGTLSVKKPGRLRLEYTNGQVIVIDGKEAWFYSRKNEQAIRRTFKDFQQANIPVAFLLGAANIRDDFEVAERQEGAVGDTLDLIPRKKGAGMKRIGLVCDDDGRITALIIYDRSGNTSSIAFSDVRENVGLDDPRFEFKVPKGTEVIEQ